MTTPTFLEMAGLTAGIVQALRDRVPRLDGWPVLVVALLVSVLVVLSAEPPSDWRTLVLAILRTWLGAVGGVAVLKKTASAMGTAMGASSSLPPLAPAARTATTLPPAAVEAAPPTPRNT